MQDTSAPPPQCYARQGGHNTDQRLFFIPDQRLDSCLVKLWHRIWKRVLQNTVIWNRSGAQIQVLPTGAFWKVYALMSCQFWECVPKSQMTPPQKSAVTPVCLRRLVASEMKTGNHPCFFRLRGMVSRVWGRGKNVYSSGRIQDYGQGAAQRSFGPKFAQNFLQTACTLGCPGSAAVAISCFFGQGVNTKIDKRQKLVTPAVSRWYLQWRLGIPNPSRMLQ